MSVVYPQYLWLLAGVPFLMLFWGAGLWHHWRMRRRFGDLTNLEEISRVSPAGHGWLRGGLFAASLVCMIVGLARPQVLSRDVRAVPQATDVIFMLETSPSMFARDMDPADSALGSGARSGLWQSPRGPISCAGLGPRAPRPRPRALSSRSAYFGECWFDPVKAQVGSRGIRDDVTARATARRASMI
jgi:hypothetical protein